MANSNPFTQTLTINAYAVKNKITSMQLIKNPEKNTLFAKDSNGTTYRVSLKITKQEDLKTASVSWFTPDDGKPASWMVHPTGEQANVIGEITFGAGALATF